MQGKQVHFTFSPSLFLEASFNIAFDLEQVVAEVGVQGVSKTAGALMFNKRVPGEVCPSKRMVRSCNDGLPLPFGGMVSPEGQIGSRIIEGAHSLWVMPAEAA